MFSHPRIDVKVAEFRCVAHRSGAAALGEHAGEIYERVRVSVLALDVGKLQR